MANRDPGGSVVVFLMGDAVICAKVGQKAPEGYYNAERMLRRVISGKEPVLLCGTCMDARGVGDGDITESARRSRMDELAEASLTGDKLFVF